MTYSSHTLREAQLFFIRTNYRRARPCWHAVTTSKVLLWFSSLLRLKHVLTVYRSIRRLWRPCSLYELSQTSKFCWKSKSSRGKGWLRGMPLPDRRSMCQRKTCMTWRMPDSWVFCHLTVRPILGYQSMIINGQQVTIWNYEVVVKIITPSTLLDKLWQDMRPVKDSRCHGSWPVSCAEFHTDSSQHTRLPLPA